LLCNCIIRLIRKSDEMTDLQWRQVAQLLQRDRAAGWVSYSKKWKTGTGRQYNRHDRTGLSSTTVTYLASKAIEFGEKCKKGYYAVQGHSRSVPTASLYATSY